MLQQGGLTQFHTRRADQHLVALPAGHASIELGRQDLLSMACRVNVGTLVHLPWLCMFHFRPSFTLIAPTAALQQRHSHFFHDFL